PTSLVKSAECETQPNDLAGSKNNGQLSIDQILQQGSIRYGIGRFTPIKVYVEVVSKEQVA
ncbi:hypothetical protein HHI36_009501, partial [Cryptolaemus montrouzieri]